MWVVAWTLVACLFSAPVNAGEQDVVSDRALPNATTTEPLQAYLHARVEDLRAAAKPPWPTSSAPSTTIVSTVSHGDRHLR